MIIIQANGAEGDLEEKILALLRREDIAAERVSLSSRHTLTFPELTIDGRSQQAFQNGTALALTRIEFNMLLLLASNPGVTLSKEDLFSAVWGRDSADTLKVVANTVSNLRRKMGGSQTYIRTVRGGYVFSAVSVDRLKCPLKTNRSKAAALHSPAGPRRLGTATRISASLFRRLSAFFGSPPGQDPKAAKFAVLTPGPGRFANVRNAPRVVIPPPHPKRPVFRRVSRCVRFFERSRGCTRFYPRKQTWAVCARS